MENRYVCAGGGDFQQKTPHKKQRAGYPPVVLINKHYIMIKLVKFKKKSTFTATVTEQTINSIVGVGGKYRPSQRANFLNKDKKVNILMIDKTGKKTATINLSTQVSRDLRNQDITLKEIGALPIYEDTVDILNPKTEELEPTLINYVGYPGNAEQTDNGSYTVDDDDLTAEAVTSEFDWEDHIAID